MDADPASLTIQEDRIEIGSVVILAISLTLGLVVLAGTIYGILSGFKPLPELTQ